MMLEKIRDLLQKIDRVIEEARKGRVEYRVDKTSNIHIPIGKRSFAADALLENLAAVVDSIVRNRPASSKGAYIRRAYLTSTMGPAARIDVSELTALRAMV